MSGPDLHYPFSFDVTLRESKSQVMERGRTRVKLMGRGASRPEHESEGLLGRKDRLIDNGIDAGDERPVLQSRGRVERHEPSRGITSRNEGS